MSQVNVNLGGSRYSIEDFQELASKSRDNQELRIRVSNQELTNTSLGCLASVFKHKASNTQVNRAFMQSILTDNRYQCVARQIHSALSTTMPEQEALTPAKIRTALCTANSILRAHVDGVEIGNRMANANMLPEGMINEFASYYTNYMAEHPDIKCDSQDFGNPNLLSAEERKLPEKTREKRQQGAEAARIRPLGDLIKSFYLQGDRVERSGFFKFQPSECANDPAKAEALNKLFSENCETIPKLKTKASINDALQTCFDSGDPGKMPKSGSIFSVWKDDLHRRFLDCVNQTSHSKNNNFAFCSTKDIEYLRQNAPTNGTVREKNQWLETISRGLDQALKIHPEWTQPGHEEEISNLLSHLCQVSKANQGKFLCEELAEATVIKHDVLLNVNSEPIKALCKDLKLSSVGLSALKTQEFLAQATPKAKGLKTEAEITQLVQQEAKTFLETNRATLEKLEEAASGFEPKDRDSLIKVGMPLLNLLEKMEDGQGSEVKLLRQTNLVADRFFAEDLDDAGRGKILKTIIDTFTKNKTVDEQINLCQTNKGRLEKFLAELSSIEGKAGTPPAVLESCDRTKTLLQGIYTQLLNKLPDQEEALLLNPKAAEATNPNLVKQMEPIRNSSGQIIRNLERNANSGEIFTALQELEKGKSDEAKIFKPLVEQTRCPDISLLKNIHSITGGDVTKVMKSIYKDGDYASDIKHYYRDIFELGKNLMSVAKNFPQYSSNDISNLYADIFLATHTDEELAKTLKGLQSGDSHLALNVLFNHANKESQALQGQSSDKVNYAFTALGVLDQIQSKIAQKLHRPEPDSIFKNFDPEKTMRDLPLQDQLNCVLPDEFTTHLSNLDTKLFMAKDRLNNADYNQLKNFVSQLKLPDKTTVGSGKNRSEFETTYTNSLGEQEEDTWNVDNLSSIFANNARKVSNLLKETNGNPTAAQLWTAVHGGRPPSRLNMNNFAEKLMQNLTQEIRDFSNLVGIQEMPVYNFIYNCDASVGIPLDTIMDKLSHANQEDVTFTMDDQVMETGFFGDGSGVEYATGKDAYAFANDFHRAKMPPGAIKVSDDGCKITVVANGKEQVFTQKDFHAFNEANGINSDSNPTLDHPFVQNLVGSVESLCQTKEQLAGVGLCTTQFVQMSLRNMSFIYKDISGGAREHTALDHRIEKQEDGTIKVSIKEKPGSLFKLDMEYLVGADGSVKLNKGSITLPSIPKWNENMQANV